MSKSYFNEVFSHYQKCWNAEPNAYLWEKGPIQNLPFDFRVLEFPPLGSRNMWTYGTCCMSDLSSVSPIELHIFSSDKDEGLIELLTAITYYHKNTTSLNLNHTVNFGKPWKTGSVCEYGLISPPYLDGPALENLQLPDATVKFYWLVPITKNEVDYKKKYGVDSLERMFDSSSFNYLDAARRSLVNDGELVAMKTYNDKEIDLSFDYPDTWTIKRDKNILSLFDSEHGCGALQMSFYEVANPKNISLDSELEEYIVERHGQAEILKSNNFVFSNYLHGENKRSWKYWLFVKATVIVFASYNCEDNDVGKESEVVDSIVRSAAIS